MKEFKFKKIDAFASKNSGGNPAGYIWLDSPTAISATEMQQIAIELKGYVNEVGYIYKISDGFFDLKFYSSEREVDFCGHATIAIMYDLIQNDTKLQKAKVLQIRTNRGILEVENRIESENAVFIMSPKAVEKETLPNTRDIAKHLNIDLNDIDTHLPIEIINAGLSTLLVPIKSLDSILKISPDLEFLKSFCINSGIDIIEVFTNEISNPSNHFRTRVFAPTFGYIEDPATGSGNSAFGYYIMKHNLWTVDTISIEQNGLLNKYNIVKLQQKIDDAGNTRVLFGGGAITRIDGKYFIQ